MPLFVDDGETFQVTQKFVMMIIHQRLTKVISDVIATNTPGMKQTSLSCEGLGQIVGHVIGNVMADAFTSVDGQFTEGSRARYSSFITSFNEGYVEALHIRDSMKSNES